MKGFYLKPLVHIQEIKWLIITFSFPLTVNLWWDIVIREFLNFNCQIRKLVKNRISWNKSVGLYLRVFFWFNLCLRLFFQSQLQISFGWFLCFSGCSTFIVSAIQRNLFTNCLSFFSLNLSHCIVLNADIGFRRKWLCRFTYMQGGTETRFLCI